MTCTVCMLSEFRAWKSMMEIKINLIVKLFCTLCRRGHIPLPCSPPQLCRQCGAGLYSVTPTPRFLDQPMRNKGAKVSGQVASNTKSLPFLHSTVVTPSGLFLSDFERPDISAQLRTDFMKF